jgi:hypothetical protein
LSEAEERRHRYRNRISVFVNNRFANPDCDTDTDNRFNWAVAYIILNAVCGKGEGNRR